MPKLNEKPEWEQRFNEQFAAIDDTGTIYSADNSIPLPLQGVSQLEVIKDFIHSERLAVAKAMKEKTNETVAGFFRQLPYGQAGGNYDQGWDDCRRCCKASIEAEVERACDEFIASLK